MLIGFAVLYAIFAIIICNSHRKDADRIFLRGTTIVVAVVFSVAILLGFFGIEQYDEVVVSIYVDDVQNFKVIMTDDCCILGNEHEKYYATLNNSTKIETFSNEELRDCKVEVRNQYKRPSDFGYALFNFGLFNIDSTIVSKTTIRIECPESCVIVLQQMSSE